MLKSQNALKKTLIWLGVFILVCLFFLYVKSALEKRQASPESQTKPPLESSSDFIKMNPATGLPYPGSYTLEKIFKAPNLQVLDSDAVLRPLSQYTHGKITLLTFFYERCSDVNGCPYAMNVFQMVKAKLEKMPESNKQFRFVSISFDPERDTPIMMKGLEKRVSNHKEDSIEWGFLTEKSIANLLPLIDAFGQNVDVNVSSMTGSQSLTYQHVLKVYLIDQESNIREIYSTSFLSKEVILNDIETLLIEQKNKKTPN